MDANKDGTIDLEEWEKFMTPELKAAIQAKLDDSGLVKGFKPLVDIAKVKLNFYRNLELIFIRKYKYHILSLFTSIFNRFLTNLTLTNLEISQKKKLHMH